MLRDEYNGFSERLRERVAADGRALGLVAVGSMAAVDYQPDQWSDHDFFVVTAPGIQEELRTDMSWLPDADRIVFWHRETDHGLQVFYDDGHLLEFAVFDLEELELAGVNRYRVLLDRGGVEARMAAVRTQTHARPRHDDTHQFGKFLACVQVGAGRARRGEELSAAILDLCIEHGGSITGEHGVGADKKKHMGRMFSEVDLDVMQMVRCAFDPDNLCNPGKVFPTPRLCGERPGRRQGAHPLQDAGVAEIF